MDRKLLSIYLNDHLTALTAGVELSKRSAGSNEGAVLGDFLAEAASQVDAEKAVLLDLMERLSVRRDHVKQLAGWSGEKLGRLKLNGRLTGYSPLSRVTELEALLLITRMTAALWRGLVPVLGGDPDFGDLDLQARAANADALADRVEEHRVAAVAEALKG
jgi:hypothetical protein